MSKEGNKVENRIRLNEIDWIMGQSDGCRKRNVNQRAIGWMVGYSVIRIERMVYKLMNRIHSTIDGTRNEINSWLQMKWNGRKYPQMKRNERKELEAVIDWENNQKRVKGIIRGSVNNWVWKKKFSLAQFIKIQHKLVKALTIDVWNHSFHLEDCSSVRKELRLQLEWSEIGEGIVSMSMSVVSCFPRPLSNETSLIHQPEL